MFVLYALIIGTVLWHSLKRQKLSFLNAINFILLIYFLNFLFKTLIMLSSKHSILFDRLGMSVEDAYPFISRAMILSLLSLTLIAAGYFVFLKKRDIEPGEWEFAGSNVRINYMILGAGIVTWLLFISLNGGLDFLITVIRFPYRFRNGQIVPAAGFLRWGVIVASLFIYANLAQVKKLRLVDLLLIFAYGFVLYSFGCSVNAPLLFFLGVLIVYDLAVKRVKPLAIVGMGILLFLLIAFLKLGLSQSRPHKNADGSIETPDLSLSKTLLAIPEYAVGGTNFAGIDVLSMIVKYFPGKLNYYYGASLVDTVVKIIPFVPQTTVGTRLNQVILNTENRGNNPTLPGIFYLNFGIPAVIFFSFLFGWFCAAIQNRLTGQPSILNILIYTITLVFFVIFMTRTGALTVAAKRYVYMLCGLFVYHGLLRLSANKKLNSQK